MAKPVGPLCNLACKYCFYLEKDRLFPPAEKWIMTPEIVEKFIREYIESQPTPVVSFAWQGGEPTLAGLDFFRQVIRLQKKYSHGKRIENAFQTNGILLDDCWCEFLSENRFLVGLSIDGPQEIHDKYRLYKNGKPTFDKVMAALDCLKRHAVEFNTLTCVYRENSYRPQEIYDFLKSIGSRFMQFIPIVARKARDNDGTGLTLVPPTFQGEAAVTEWSVEPLQYGKFMMSVFNSWVRKDVGTYFIQLFDVCLGSWVGQSAGLCIFAETCGWALALEHNGDLYSCDHFVFPENRLGNIREESLGKLANSAKQIRFGRDKADTLPRVCRRCDVRFLCNGGCPKNRFVKTTEGDPGLNYLCAGYQYFFHTTAPYMRYMVSELNNRRPPANVMDFARQKDKHFPGVDRNDPCPCGSGVKFKDCCGSVR
ncbi:MAG: anaerobic sulfatase-maturation protein [Fidelibacterota bacterium]